MLPEVAELRHVPAGDVVGNGHARQFDDAAFDGVHQREVAHRPREQRSFGVARAAQEERRRGEVHHAGDAELALDDFKSGDPEPRGLVVLLGFFLVIALQIADLVYFGLCAVTVMSLVIEHEDVLQAHQAGHHSLDHLSFGFQRVQFFAAALEQGAAALGKLDALAKLESVVIRDDDLGAIELAEHVAGNQLPVLVVAVRVVRLEHAEPVADGQARRHDEKAAGESGCCQAGGRR